MTFFKSSKPLAHRMGLRAGLVGWTVLAATVPSSVRAQEADHGLVAAAGSQYRAGLFHRWILGRHYRDLWTQIVEVERLDLSSFAGGLVPLRAGGGQQTKSLRFMGADGREYSFRSVDKDPSAVIDSILHGTIIDELVQDGISAAHPYGAVVAAPLLDAAGVLHVEPKLVLMPDSPDLGAFRETFAGVLGLIEERPDENEGERTAFAGTLRVIASERLVERLEDGPNDQVDGRAFLTARLMDIFLGDWDRHRDQWRWAIFSDEAPRQWLPVPRDRDQAFSKFDGLATRIVSLYMPQFVRFGDAYPDMTSLHWNGRELDRWFLSGVPWAVWDSVATSLKTSLTDEVIDEAVQELPGETLLLNREELSSALQARRDHLDEAANSFYRLLAADVDIHATGSDEVVTIELQAGRVHVAIAAPDVISDPYFSRTFEAEETREIRIYLGRGDDRVSIRGVADPDIEIRIIGGRGDDQYDFESDGQGVQLYDFQGTNRSVGTGAPAIDDREYVEWVWTEEDRDQPRDWGRRSLPIFWSSYSSDLGPFVGGGVSVERYGFRRQGYAHRFDIRAGFAPTSAKGRLEIDGRVNRENSRAFLGLRARVSRLDVIQYYGVGNNTTSSGRDFHEVGQTNLLVGTGLGITGDGFVLSGDVSFQRVSTDSDAGGFYETLGDIYGGGGFSQLVTSAQLQWDPLRDRERTAHRLRVETEASFFPALLDVERSFARARIGASALLAPSPSPWVELALRTGAEQVWGRFPWHQAAFLGGGSGLRGWDAQRFAGDAAVFGSAEIRLRLWRPRVIVPVRLGTFGLVDAGRVGVDGASPAGWHTSIGGGVWLQPITSPYVFHWGIAAGDESTKMFVTLGLTY